MQIQHHEEVNALGRGCEVDCMVRVYSRMLVTGGAGFIGSHIVDNLLEKGFEVTIIDNLDTGRLENIAHHHGKKEFHFIKGDI